MRIGISTSVIQRGKTGIAQYVFALLRALVLHPGNREFVLFVLEDDLPLFEFVRPRVRIITVPEKFRPPAQNIYWHQVGLPRLAGQLGLDILHVPSYRRMVARKCCGLVATIHDLAPFHVRRKYDIARMLYGKVAARVLAHRQDEIIAISNHTASDIRRFFKVNPERTTVIYNGVEHERFFPGNKERSRAWAAREFNLDRPFFLFIARLEHPAKNHVRLVQAFDQFKEATGSEWQLVLGGSDWHGAIHIHEKIQASAFLVDIRRLGFVPDNALPDLYRAADVLIYPSLFEGFGMPPIEAMSCGTPVICSTRGSLREVVGDAAAIVDPENVRSIADKMKLLSTSPAERRRLTLLGINQAAQFDWERTAAGTLAVYERVAKKCFPSRHFAASCS